jgi:putative methyltransferase
LSKSGIAAPKNHVLREAIVRHKARLSAEFVRARIRHKCATVDALKAKIDTEWKLQWQSTDELFVRWIRINTLRSSLAEEMKMTFKALSPVQSVQELKDKADGIYLDETVPNLVGISRRGSIDIPKLPSYKTGKIILQDKASCFPAYLLDPVHVVGDIIDGCAAPGNKTTHLASLIPTQNGRPEKEQKIHAFELSPHRSETLVKMTRIAGADNAVEVHGKSDFLKASPTDSRYVNVTALLLDPSCSGSGILGRDDEEAEETNEETKGPAFTLPRKATEMASKKNQSKNKQKVIPQPKVEALPAEPRQQMKADLDNRLLSLQTFQLAVILHAFTFPKATRITYSTCSIHVQENEAVVLKALASPKAKEAGWRILKREEQVEGLRKWEGRGATQAEVNKIIRPGDNGRDYNYTDEIRDGCIRCHKGGADATGGFFVACFVRD